MLKKIRLFYELIISLALLLSVASCDMDGGSIKLSPAEGAQAGGKTLVIRANVSMEEQRNASARSAVPSDFMGADGNALVFAGALHDEASGADKNFKKAEYNEGTITLSLEIERLSEVEEVERTLEIRAYKSGTEQMECRALSKPLPPLQAMPR